MENLDIKIKPEEIEVLSAEYGKKILAVLDYWLKDNNTPITDSPEIVSASSIDKFNGQDDVLGKIKEYSGEIIKDWLNNLKEEDKDKVKYLDGSYENLKKFIDTKIDYDYLKNNKG